MNIPWVESPFFQEILNRKGLSEEESKIVNEYHENGFVVLKNLFSDAMLDPIIADMNEKGFNLDYKMNEYRDSSRIQDFWKHSSSCKEISRNKKVLDTLKLLYDRNPIPFQTLNFRVGSQQRAHSDSIHFSSLPARFMCGVWVALEDITAENGPVFYYPKSQNLPEYDFSHIKETAERSSYEDYVDYENFIEKIISVNDFEKKHFYAKKGDVLIWSSNIIHGGSKVENEKSTRYSQVTHYFFENCIYYTPMLSNIVTRELFLRKNLENINTGEIVNQNYNGVFLKFLQEEKKHSILTRIKNKALRIFRE